MTLEGNLRYWHVDQRHENPPFLAHDRPGGYHVRSANLRSPHSSTLLARKHGNLFIATKLEEGHPVEVIPLANPPGRIGYVMKIRLGDEIPLPYVKLELGSGIVYGRSFHYSDYF